jgi:hypothetical protein
MISKLLKISVCASTLFMFCACQSARAVEIITLRSGQYLGAPGAVGDPDDIVRYYSEGTNTVPLATVFDTEFAAADTGPPALVIQPHPFWVQTLPADPLARWINPHEDTFGTAESALYSVPFTVTTPGTSIPARLKVFFAVDDVLGDTIFGGPNPEGMYMNGAPITGSSGGNFGAQTFFSANVTVDQGLNHLYFYQRDAGAGVSGMIFSAKVCIPEPATWVLALGSAGFALLGRRKRCAKVI